MSRPSKLRLGTRGSLLALAQADWVKERLTRRHPGLEVSLTVIKTKGDKILDVPLAKVGGKGLFVKEIEDALLAGEIDLAVHSMKDVPAKLPEGLIISAIPEREDPRDVLITQDGSTLDRLSEGAKVGTSSLRRGAQLLALRPDLDIVPLRGNLDTRLKKLFTENLDAIVLAAAGLIRAKREETGQHLDPDAFIPAVGQGALGIETREDDPGVRGLLEVLEHPETRARVAAERAFLERLEGGCQVPLAAHAEINGDTISINGMVAELDGRRVIRREMTGPIEDAHELGLRLAAALLDAGADAILKEIYGG